MNLFRKKSCRSRNFKQVWYSKVFHLRAYRRRKTDFTNGILEFRVNYETAINSISSLLTPFIAVRRWTSRPSATRRALAAPPAKSPRASSISLETAPSSAPRARHAPRRPLSATPHEDGRRRASVSSHLATAQAVLTLSRCQTQVRLFLFSR